MDFSMGRWVGEWVGGCESPSTLVHSQPQCTHMEVFMDHIHSADSKDGRVKQAHHLWVKHTGRFPEVAAHCIPSHIGSRRSFIHSPACHQLVSLVRAVRLASTFLLVTLPGPTHHAGQEGRVGRVRANLPNPHPPPPPMDGLLIPAGPRLTRYHQGCTFQFPIIQDAWSYKEQKDPSVELEDEGDDEEHNDAT
jgi:hypothetical protein